MWAAHSSKGLDLPPSAVLLSSTGIEEGLLVAVRPQGQQEPLQGE